MQPLPTVVGATIVENVAPSAFMIFNFEQDMRRCSQVGQNWSQGPFSDDNFGLLYTIQ